MKRLLPVALVLAGCATQPGTGFATLEDAVLSVPAPLPAGRLDDRRRWKTANGYALSLDGNAVTLTVADLALQAPGAAQAAAGTYQVDPANPPPGYGPCHGGHCHRADGSEATYEQIAAEVAGTTGGAAPPQTVVTLSAGPAAPALTVPTTDGAPTLTLGAFKPSRYLGQTALSRAVLRVASIQVSGTVAPVAGGADAAPRRFTIGLEGPVTFVAPVTAQASVTGPAGFGVGGTLRLSEKLLDGLPFERLLAASAGDLDLAADADAREAFADNLAKSTFTATLTARQGAR